MVKGKDAAAGGNADRGPAANGNHVEPQLKARILAEALPHLIRYDDETVVIKFGGNAMGDQALADAFAKDIVYLKKSGVNPVVVHGGGPQIAAMLKRVDIKSDFVHGLRVTDKASVEIVEMVLAGAINKDIVSAINRQGGLAGARAVAGSIPDEGAAVSVFQPLWAGSDLVVANDRSGFWNLERWPNAAATAGTAATAPAAPADWQPLLPQEAV